MSILDKLNRKNYAHCIICKRLAPVDSFGVLTGGIGVCGECHEHLPFVPVGTTYERKGDRINYSSSVFFYSSPIKELIIEYKFKWCTAYADVFAEYMKTYMEPLFGDRQTFDLVIPVPLSDKRLRKRGYNQSELLSERVSKHFGFPHNTTALVRTKSTSRQSGLPGWKRAKNMEDAFSADRDQVSGKSVLLIDDVFTTGTTAGACAKALYEADASSITVFTVARKWQLNKSREYYNLFSR